MLRATLRVHKERTGEVCTLPTGSFFMDDERATARVLAKPKVSQDKRGNVAYGATARVSWSSNYPLAQYMSNSGEISLSSTFCNPTAKSQAAFLSIVLLLVNHAIIIPFLHAYLKEISFS